MLTCYTYSINMIKILFTMTFIFVEKNKNKTNLSQVIVKNIKHLYF